MSLHEPWVISAEDLAFLERHDATLSFGVGKKVGVDWRRDDGLRLQHSGATIANAVGAARASERLA